VKDLLLIQINQTESDRFLFFKKESLIMKVKVIKKKKEEDLEEDQEEFEQEEKEEVEVGSDQDYIG